MSCAIKTKNDNIHTPRDFRGPRNVFVNGNKIKFVVYADTKKGIVKYHPHPVRRKRGSNVVYTRTLKGLVTVEFIR
ncbi:hypothetical protein EA004_20605 [Vibrio anguillarum]|uniref:50S ribosomal protein L21e n=3 Tax=Vibrio anguillarum TaxID=55601 RepID=A0AAW4AEM5_VIBAN|nr:hypothetical protein Her_0057 [Vibrio phage Her]AOT26345.1 hypothetical protein CLA_0057 [Vibrio phage Cla]AOT26527.1 hypothetical protein Pel_0057 [Vibrio phage Pel]AOT26618.1 hypothetical protein pVa2_0056 [Vibrio phage pVa-2]AOT26709.1 hypothetical protein pVa1_0057 [Vibrio phage pVa-1]AOT26800.1 hypothetical protein pVa5_0057 [Vibrio phage vB_VspP_pVa5_12Jun]AOT26891.1 hypothetical protein pVa6_0057 [Vibrio phage pVa-6]AOT26985.1 hypothetical protein VaK_0057 [Vibrio phage VaK]AOT270